MLTHSNRSHSAQTGALHVESRASYHVSRVFVIEPIGVFAGPFRRVLLNMIILSTR
jgi:hypothetical protein